MRRGQGTGTGLRRCHTSRPPRPRPPAHLRAGARGRGANSGCCAHARMASASAGASALASRALTCVDHHVVRAATTAPCASCSAHARLAELAPLDARRHCPEEAAVPASRASSPPFRAFHDDMMRDGSSGNPQCDRRGGPCASLVAGSCASPPLCFHVRFAPQRTHK